MKTTQVVFLLLMSISACTEEVIVEKEVEKVVYKDSIRYITLEVDKDTVVVREYGPALDTLYMYNLRPVSAVPEQLRVMVAEFYNLARLNGRTPVGDLLLVIIADLDEVVQAESFYGYGQLTIRLNGNQTIDEMFIPFMREMARQYLGAEYSQDPQSLMYPFYPSSRIRWSNRGEYANEINTIFKE